MVEIPQSAKLYNFRHLSRQARNFYYRFTGSSMHIRGLICDITSVQ